MSLLLPFAILLMLIGACAGILSGLLGVGGGIFLVPALFYAFSALGYSSDALMQICLATSLATIIVTSVRSIQSHNKQGAVDWDILRTWAPGIAVGAVVGMLTVSGLETQTLQVIFGAMALIVGLYMGFGRPEWRLGHAMPTGMTRIVMSPTLGFFSVLMGIGGGSFGVPLMSLYNTAIHRAVATAAGFGVIIAVPAVIGFVFVETPAMAPPWSIGLVNVPSFILIIAMTLITTPYGAKLAHSMDARPLKRVFAVFLIAVALNMLRQALL